MDRRASHRAFKPGAATGSKTDLDNLLLIPAAQPPIRCGGAAQEGTALDFDLYRPDGTLLDHVTRGPP